MAKKPMDPHDPRLVPYDPELYDLTHRGNPGDVAFYVRACRGAQQVLELGCGSGRITRALARAGARVTGLDTHAGLLAQARRIAADLEPALRGRLSYVQADMRAFELDRAFDRITIPYNGLYCLLTDEDVAACFAAVKSHLAPGGQLILDAYRVFCPDPDYEPEPEPDELDEPIGILSDGQLRLDVYERSDWDQPSQRLDAWYRYRIHGPGGACEEKTFCIPQRYLYPDQLDRLLDTAGLAVARRSGGFDGREFDDQAETMVVFATHAP